MSYKISGGGKQGQDDREGTKGEGGLHIPIWPQGERGLPGPRGRSGKYGEDGTSGK